MQCREVRELADSFLSEQLLVETNHEIVRHLETCPDCRADIAARMPNVPALDGLTRLAFSRPMEARSWLQASNPSERWKWDFMYQDLPPVKGEVDPSAVPLAPGAIPLRAVK